MTLKMKQTAAVWLVTTILVTTTLAQSPFQPPKDADFRRGSQPQGRSSYTNRHNQGADNLVRLNPFTPPPSFDRQQTTRRVVTTPPSRHVPVAQPEVHTPAPRVGSPFTPPNNQEWRDDNIIPQAPRRSKDLNSRKQRKPGKGSSWLNALEERQRANADSIPSVSNVQVSSTPRRRRRYRGNKPRASVYQEDIKDMHDTRPGVTPWTRYTEKPRVHGDDGDDTDSTIKGVARCGHLRYSPRSQICCGGQVVRRHGVSPACCGKTAYDNVFNKCCKGVVSTRVLGEADC